MKLLARRSWLPHFLMSVVASSVLIGGANTHSSVSTNAFGNMTLQDGKLTAHIVAAPLQQVIAEISRLTGARVFWIGPEGGEKVSAEFIDVPLASVLRRILGEKNFMLFYTSAEGEARLTKIWISSTEEGSSHTGPIPSTPTASRIPPRIMQTALYGQDVSSRLRAIERLKGYARTDPRAKSILSQVSRNAVDPQVRETAEKALGGLK